MFYIFYCKRCARLRKHGGWEHLTLAEAFNLREREHEWEVIKSVCKNCRNESGALNEEEEADNASSDSKKSLWKMYFKEFDVNG